jgi:RHS repeat-associated protein
MYCNRIALLLILIASVFFGSAETIFAHSHPGPEADKHNTVYSYKISEVALDPDNMKLHVTMTVHMCPRCSPHDNYVKVTISGFGTQKTTNTPVGTTCTRSFVFDVSGLKVGDEITINSDVWCEWCGHWYDSQKYKVELKYQSGTNGLGGGCKLTLVRIASSVDIATGNLFDSYAASPDKKLPVTLSYNSRSPRNSRFGHGWNDSLDLRVMNLADGSTILINPDGREDIFTLNSDGTYSPPPGVHDRLEQAHITLFSDDMENGPGVWTADTPWGQTNAMYHSAETSWTDSPGGNYANNLHTALTMQLDLSNASEAEMHFQHRFALESGYDFGYIEISDDNGANWTMLDSYTGFQNDWAAQTVSLDDYAGLADLLLRFRLITDANTTEDGWYIDDVEITAASGYVLHRKNGGSVLFNGQGRTSELQDSNGNTTQYTYTDDILSSVTGPYDNTLNFTDDGNGHITLISDSSGRSFAFEYDTEGNLSAITDSAGSRREFSYDANHNLIQRTDPTGGVTQYSYDEQDRLINAIDVLGATRTVTHETNGLTALIDPTGNRTEYGYNEQLDLTSETSPLGNVTAYEWDEDRNLTKETDPEGNETVREYDDSGNNTRTVDPMGNETLTEYVAGSGCSSCGGGKPTKVTDAQGNVTEYTYDDSGNRTSVRDALGNITFSTYDVKGQLLTETGANGAVTAYEYDAAGNIIRETDALGNEVTHQYDGAGNLISTTDALGNVSGFTYDVLGRQLTVTDALGNTTATSYDAVGNVVSIINASGNETRYAYDLKGNRTSMIAPDGSTTSYTYNFDGQLTRTSYPDGTTEENSYDADGRKISETDRNGNVTSYTYTPSGRLATITGPDGATVEYTYDANGNRLTEKDARGNITSYECDSLNRVVRTIDATGQETLYSYDALGREIAVTTADGTTSYVYDVAGNLISETRPDGTTVGYEYDLLNRQTAVIDTLGNRTAYEYDPLGRLVTTTDPTGGVTRTVYDAVGNVIKSIDALGRETLYEYNMLNQLFRITDPEGNVIEYSYDVVGNRITATDPAGGVTRFEYDVNSRLVRIVYPDGTTVQNFYDGAGNLIRVIDQNGNEKIFTYDARNRKISETDALGNTTSFTYDASGNQTGFTTPDAAETDMTYSSTNQLLSKTLPDGSVRSTAYTARGRIASVTNARGQVVAYSYDSYGKLTKKSWTTGSETFSYDSAGRPVSVTHTEGADSNTVAFTYDALGRVLSETQNSGTVGYAYDVAGNIVRITYPSGKIAEYTYTDNDRIETVSMNSELILTYSYDARGLITGAVFGNGIIMNKNYDAVGRTLSVIYEKDGQTLDGYEYTYDAAGNRLSKTDLAVPEQSDLYAYDDIYQLLEYAKGTVVDDAIERPLHSRAWTYDVMGNWLDAFQSFGYTDNFNRPNTAGQRDDIGGPFTENGSLKSRIRNEQAELRRSNNGRFELPALLPVRRMQGLPSSMNALFSFDKGSKKEEEISAGFLFGYQNPDNYWWAGARLEHGNQFWTLGQTVDGLFTPVHEVQGSISDKEAMALELWFDGNEAKLYRNQELKLAYDFGTMTGGAGLIGTQNKSLVDDFWLITEAGDERRHNEVNELIERNGQDLVYDDDGNLLDDGSKTYAWDIFNRLISVTTADVRIAFSYDAQGRRVSKEVDLGNDGSVESETVYSYSGWNCIEEQIIENGVQATKVYAWGNDLSGTVQGAGGVGGLLAVTDGTGMYSAASDANGNITAYFGDNGEIVAEYDYTPFGSILSSSGEMADEFAYRFSTKPYDEETELYYYGYRYYSPELGRWVSRDPISDLASMTAFLSTDELSVLAKNFELAHLYRFVENNPVRKWDYKGLTSIGSILRAFFWPWDRGQGLWVMGENDSYTHIVRAWAPVQGNISRLKRAVASTPQDWEKNHITSPSWIPTMSYAPDPKNGWNALEQSPPGTDSDTAKRNFIIFVLTGYTTDELHTSAIGSFRVIATADEVDMSKCRVKLNVWMYNEMSQRSFGRFADHPLFSWRPMRSQFMWWNWKEEFGFDTQGNVRELTGSGGGW